MTDYEKAVVMAYTGTTMLQGERLGVFYMYLEKILGFPVWTHELASKKMWELIHEKSKADFMKICEKEDDHVIRDCRTCANREVTAYHEKHGEFGWCDFVDFNLQEDDFCSRWKAKE